MAPVRLYRRAEIRELLRMRDCHWVKDLPTFSYWRSARIKLTFQVPEVADLGERWVLPEEWEEVDAMLKKYGI